MDCSSSSCVFDRAVPFLTMFATDLLSMQLYLPRFCAAMHLCHNMIVFNDVMILLLIFPVAGKYHGASIFFFSIDFLKW